MTIGEIVRKRREELGFSTYEVALHLSLDEKHFKQIEANSVVPGIADIHGVLGDRRSLGILQIDPGSPCTE